MLKKYIGIFLINNPSSGIWSCPFSMIVSNYVLTVVTSFEVYVSDVIGRRFEKVKNGHIFENMSVPGYWYSDNNVI